MLGRHVNTGRRTILDELKEHGQLPSPRGAALHVLQLCQKDDVTNQEVAHAIQADPALSARLIKLANAPVSHQVRPIVSVTDAVTVLGLNTVRQIVLGISLIDSSRQLSCKNFNYDNFWSHSLLRAVAAQSLVINTCAGVIPPEEAFVLGLLGQVGILAMAASYPDEYSEVIDKKKLLADVGLNDLERQKFGFDHNQLSREMFADWRMPAVFQSVILHFEDPSTATYTEGGRDWCLLHMLHVADFFAKMCLAENSARSKMMSKLVFKATRLGIESGFLIELGDRAVADWADWGRMFNIRVSKMPEMKALLDVAPLVPDPSDISHLPSTVGSAFKLRILLVDDDHAVLMVLKMLFDKAGHTVALAKNGKEALTLISSFMPQVILTDWMMPEMDGVEFCRALRRKPEWRNIYVFILTAQESTDRLVEAFEAGANDYMTKPLNTKILGARLGAAQRVVQLQEELEHDREQLRKFSRELAESNKRFQQLALTDDLTGLPNRRSANEHLARLWAVAERNHTPLSCLMIDIDHFKHVNDSFGHKAGDHALREVAKILQLSIRKQDIACRLGGEEFLVLCPDLPMDVMGRYAERLRSSVADHLIEMSAGKQIKLTISIGAASKMPGLSTSEMFLQQADKRLYQAKSKGRNLTVIE